MDQKAGGFKIERKMFVITTFCSEKDSSEQKNSEKENRRYETGNKMKRGGKDWKTRVESFKE